MDQFGPKPTDLHTYLHTYLLHLLISPPNIILHYLNTCTLLLSYVRTYVHTCCVICTFVRTYINSYEPTFLRPFPTGHPSACTPRLIASSSNICSHIHTFLHTTYVYIYTYIHTYIHTYIYSCVFLVYII